MYCLKLEINIRLININNLKEKRSFVKRITSLLRKKYNLSIIENKNNDSKKYCDFLISIVSCSKDYLLDIINKIEEDIFMNTGMQVIGEYYEIF